MPESDSIDRVVLTEAERKTYLALGWHETVTEVALERFLALKLRIRNTHSYLPKHLHEKIFEVFYMSGKTNGTGLGLPIVKRIVEAHGGRVVVESVENPTMTTFSLTLKKNIARP